MSRFPINQVYQGVFQLVLGAVSKTSINHMTRPKGGEVRPDNASIVLREPSTQSTRLRHPLSRVESCKYFERAVTYHLPKCILADIK